MNNLSSAVHPTPLGVHRISTLPWSGIRGSPYIQSLTLEISDSQIQTPSQRDVNVRPWHQIMSLPLSMSYLPQKYHSMYVPPHPFDCLIDRQCFLHTFSFYIRIHLPRIDCPSLIMPCLSQEHTGRSFCRSPETSVKMHRTLALSLNPH